MPTSDLLEGGCHCGAVRFRVRVAAREALACDCSLCEKHGYIHLIVPARDFTLVRGDLALTTYPASNGAKHLFCRICGIHPFYRPHSHPNDWDVNIRCLDGHARKLFRVIEDVAAKT